MSFKKLIFFSIFNLMVLVAFPQDTLIIKEKATVKEEEKPKKWYDLIKLSGYAQVRYNRLLETNPNLGCDQCDKSIGRNGGIFIRRARIIFSGKLMTGFTFTYSLILPPMPAVVNSTSRISYRYAISISMCF